MSHTSTIIVLLLLCVLFGQSAHAQTPLEAAPLTGQTPEQAIAQQAATELNLDEFSKPSVDIVVSASGVVGSTASLAAKTDNIDDNTSVFSWYVDDEIAPRQTGKAKTSFVFQTTKANHVVRLVISADGATVAENAVSVSAFSVSLVWSADTFVPSDYEGKALPTVGSRVTVVAVPDLRNENPEDLLYTWYVNSESVVRGALGEQEFSFVVTKNVAFVPIMVEVSNQSGSLETRRGIAVPVVKPSVLLYQGAADNQRAPDAGGFMTTNPGSKTTLVAQPFYFHVTNPYALSYEWSFAGKNALGTPPDPNVLTLSIPAESREGSSYLKLKAENPLTPGEQVQTELEVIIRNES